MSDGMSEAFGPRNRAQLEEAKKYIVLYVWKGTPKVKRFATKAQALTFAKKVKSVEDFDNWVDYIIKGTILKGVK